MEKVMVSIYMLMGAFACLRLFIGCAIDVRKEWYKGSAMAAFNIFAAIGWVGATITLVVEAFK